MLTGDEYLVEINAVVHYSIQEPSLFLFRTDAIESVLRAVSEGVLRRQVASIALDRTLALDRKQLEEATAMELRRGVGELNLGVHIHSLLLQDVHPALEVVGSFREVASALEEKSQLINEAQAYANERLPLARGECRGETPAGKSRAVFENHRRRGRGAAVFDEAGAIPKGSPDHWSSPLPGDRGEEPSGEKEVHPGPQFRSAESHVA